MNNISHPARNVAAALLILTNALTGCSAGEQAAPSSSLGNYDDASSTPSATLSSGGASVSSDSSESEASDCGAGECVDVVLTGDVLLHPPLWENAEQADGSYDFAPLLAGLKPLLPDEAIGVCNMETPLAPEGGPYRGYPSFTVPPDIAEALKETGYDACSTASNHTVDAGTEGVVRTLDTLEAAGLETTGSYRTASEAEEPLVLESNGVKVAIVVGTFSLNGLRADASWRVDMINTDRMIAKAKAAREAGADVVLAGTHDGTEYVSTPSASQEQTFKALAASGEFDAVYGHHTHSVLPIEKYDGTWLVYGLGNSVARHATDLAVNREGLTVRFRFMKDDDGTWNTEAPAWTAHIMAREPDRWCALGTDEICTTSSEDSASLERTTTTVNQLGADEDGARQDNYTP
ncbi:poly-gamma-glutamate synthesis protein (capsule biosynthesis protein) [Neomicrococcus aestuarii]|uniref:Poly-gamma-glutamate synthesis protein (Capsule biosynthesis protein) n=1 Tax=Neomicrococcus aestuarii TaxID=556325 RepID=A0A7W8WZP7_9MICC|nr:CapA family protein [Neomicrococcus aestuarii]MBB5512028.1 poly-gamma-glutamate synthesis protein (capsule biosynthesis protein) [Neomicrococcus aestuarii]